MPTIGIKFYNHVVELVRWLPYVEHLPGPRYCEAWTYSEGRKGKCLNRAEWRFKASTSKGPGRAKSGNFCTYHLVTKCIHYSKYETARADRAYEKSMKQIAERLGNA